jgi:hypothetical protein
VIKKELTVKIEGIYLQVKWDHYIDPLEVDIKSINLTGSSINLIEILDCFVMLNIERMIKKHS